MTIFAHPDAIRPTKADINCYLGRIGTACIPASVHPGRHGRPEAPPFP